MNGILIAALIFAALSLILGIILSFAGQIFKVDIDERTEKITEILPGANCGGCGYAGCSALAEAIVNGKAKFDACNACNGEITQKISEIMGIENTGETKNRYSAQVMCSGTHEVAKKKYIYAGLNDCNAANKLAGGDKLCPNGCIGLGSCVKVCKFGAITICNGVASVNPEKCRACGMCVEACPKGIIKLVPSDVELWVACKSKDKGAITKNYCDVGCIGCRICEKNCTSGAIKIRDNVAEINYDLCTGCGVCVEKCPRSIIRFGDLRNKLKDKVEKRIFNSRNAT